MAGQEEEVAEKEIVRRVRLESMEIAPFHRANTIEDISVYWIGGFPLPMPFRIRQWFLVFVTKLKAAMVERGLRQENFLGFKTIARNETERFLQTSREYKPLAGFALPPDGGLVAPPTAEDIEQSIKDGGFKLENWVGDYTYWFLNKQDERQRQDFFGLGGMLLLWLKPDPTTVPPELDMPEMAQTYFAESGNDMAALAQELYSLQDGFLEKSKVMFGEPLRQDSAYDGIPFVLPYLQAKHFLEANAETRAKWFELFDGYLLESPKDAGVLMAFKDPFFDEVLRGVLLTLKNEGIDWPLWEKTT